MEGPAGPAGGFTADWSMIPEFGRWLGRGGGTRDGEVSVGVIDACLVPLYGPEDWTGPGKYP